MLTNIRHAGGYIALTPGGLRLEHVGQPPFLQGVGVTIRINDNLVQVWVRHDPKSKYNFHQSAKSKRWSVKIPREKFSHIQDWSNWGSAQFFGEWNLNEDRGLLTFSLIVDDLPEIQGGHRSTYATSTERARLNTARDTLNRGVSKGLIDILTDPNGTVLLAFKFRR